MTLADQLHNEVDDLEVLRERSAELADTMRPILKEAILKWGETLVAEAAVGSKNAAEEMFSAVGLLLEDDMTDVTSDAFRQFVDHGRNRVAAK